jgi:hypothetical protein
MPVASRRLAARGSCFSQGHGGVGAEGERLLLSGEPVGHPPVAAARRIDQEVEAAAVAQLAGASGGLGFATDHVGERHVGISAGMRWHMPTHIPTIFPDTNRLRRTALHQRRQIKSF